jgi:hypothetical protein
LRPKCTRRIKLDQHRATQPRKAKAFRRGTQLAALEPMLKRWITSGCFLVAGLAGVARADLTRVRVTVVRDYPSGQRDYRPVEIWLEHLDGPDGKPMPGVRPRYIASTDHRAAINETYWEGVADIPAGIKSRFLVAQRFWDQDIFLCTGAGPIIEPRVNRQKYEVSIECIKTGTR